ncbi:MAG TPA: hypothetical protein VK249_10895 [Anaerolineales bacterium]|nr:hypothetical protein [Anaerolineales bacterium]
MQRVSSLVRKINSLSWLPAFLTVAGFIAYILAALDTARTKTSFLDEGMYVYKGWLFATGKYVPFQDYGLWTNHAVLSFLIPGYIQKWFGLGLDVARYFMIFLSVLTLLGLWIFSRRWGGKWWATAAIWIMALNPAEIKVYTLALSEGLIAVMLAWMLVLAVGVKRPIWQIMLGSGLAGLMILTRENMVFVLPLLFLYLLWQYGWKIGLLALVSGGLVVAIGTLWYWPEVLSIWAVRVPTSIMPVLRQFRPPAAIYGDAPRIVKLETRTDYRVFLYFWLTFRLHFVTLVSAVAVWLLWPLPKGFHVSERMRAAIFLSVLLLVLLLAHMQASIGGEVCVSCILLYVGYFDFIGFLLLVVAHRFLVRDLSTFRRTLVLAMGAIIIVSIGSTTHEDLSSDFAKAMIERLDRVYLWHALLNLTGLPHLLLFRATFVLLVSVLVVVLFALGLLWTRRFYADRRVWSRRVGLIGLNSLLILGLILSPTKVLGKGNDFFDCDGSNVLASYERAGEYLRSVIPPGSQVYWDGRIDAIFLYLPDVKVYPPQLNHTHSFFIGGNTDALLRIGLWNDVLAKQWLAEADYVLIESGLKQDWVMQILKTDKYIQLKASPKTEKCRWQSAILVYKRVGSSE